MITGAERTNSKYEFYQRLGDKQAFDLKAAMPGIVQSFDDVEQTVTVQPAIQERVVDGLGNVSMVSLPLLLDVPVCFIGGGGYTMTFPIKQGDECLVIFGDQCIDSWWSLGGVQAPIEQRRHDLSDGFAIVGLRSQPRVLSGYSSTSTQLRSDDGTQYIDLSSAGIKIKGNVTIEGTLATSGSASITGALTSGAITAQSAEIGGISSTGHTHISAIAGSPTSGPS